MLGKDLGISTINVGGGGKFRVTHVTHNNTQDEERSYSPDGKKIVYTGWWDGHDSEVYTMNVNGKDRVRLTHNNTEDYYPDYSPNGRRVAFAGTGENTNHIYTISAHGEISLKSRGATILPILPTARSSPTHGGPTVTVRSIRST